MPASELRQPRSLQRPLDWVLMVPGTSPAIVDYVLAGSHLEVVTVGQR